MMRNDDDDSDDENDDDDDEDSIMIMTHEGHMFSSIVYQMKDKVANC